PPSPTFSTPARRQLSCAHGPYARGKKVDPPGGTTGQVGCGTGWMRRPCRTQDPQSERFRAKACPGPDPGWIPVRVTKTRQTQNALSRSSIRSSVVVAGANSADVVA